MYVKGHSVNGNQYAIYIYMCVCVYIYIYIFFYFISSPYLVISSTADKIKFLTLMVFFSCFDSLVNDKIGGS